MERVKIGWARREFSLDEPVQIPGQGYMRVSEGIMDPLYATALAIDGGEGQGTVIFLSIDHIAVRFIQPIRELIKEKDPTVPVDTLVMNATHTHTGMVLDKTVEKTPDGAPIYPGEKACEHYKQQASDAVVAAWRARKPGGIAYGYGYAVVGHSRRVTYMEDIGKDDPLAMAPNGTAAMYGSTKDKRFAGYEAGADHFLNCLYTFDEDDRLTGMILNVPCPSQVSEQLTRLSADYWGDVREQMKDVFGPDVYLLQQCGAAGDTSPRILHYRAAQERRMRLKYGVEYNYKNSGQFINESRFNQRLIPLHVDDQIHIRKCLSYLGQPVGAGGMVSSGHHGLAPIGFHSRYNAFIIGRHNSIRNFFGLYRPVVNPANHGLARNILQWFARQAGGCITGGNNTKYLHNGPSYFLFCSPRPQFVCQTLGQQ